MDREFCSHWEKRGYPRLCVVLGISYGNGVTGSWAGFVCMFVASTLGYDFALESLHCLN